MDIFIFDVEHGFCGYIIADNRNVMLIDCGYNSITGFRPSTYLPRNRCSGIERLVISNYDEDHIDDLPVLRAKLPIEALYRNRSLNADQLRNIKGRTGPISHCMESLLNMIQSYSNDAVHLPELSGIEMETFSNPYPTFQDTNNLSLVTFVHCRSTHIVFPGDLEKPGWRRLLEDSNFRSHLRQVNLFVASHHGRESGYCPEVFDTCHPELVIISDEHIRYETQETYYRQHAKGIPWGTERRYVLTTRRDGMVTIRQGNEGGAKISTSRG